MGDTDTNIYNPDKIYMYTCLSCGVIISQSEWGSWMGSSLDNKMKNEVRKVFNNVHSGKSQRTSFACEAAHLFHETLFKPAKGQKQDPTETRKALKDPPKDGFAFRLGCKSPEIGNQTSFDNYWDNKCKNLKHFMCRVCNGKAHGCFGTNNEKKTNITKLVDFMKYFEVGFSRLTAFCVYNAWKLYDFYPNNNTQYNAWCVSRFYTSVAMYSMYVSFEWDSDRFIYWHNFIFSELFLHDKRGDGFFGAMTRNLDKGVQSENKWDFIPNTPGNEGKHEQWLKDIASVNITPHSSSDHVNVFTWIRNIQRVYHENWYNLYNFIDKQGTTDKLWSLTERQCDDLCYPFERNIEYYWSVSNTPQREKLELVLTKFAILACDFRGPTVLKSIKKFVPFNVIIRLNNERNERHKMIHNQSTCTINQKKYIGVVANDMFEKEQQNNRTKNEYTVVCKTSKYFHCSEYETYASQECNSIYYSDLPKYMVYCQDVAEQFYLVCTNRFTFLPVNQQTKYLIMENNAERREPMGFFDLEKVDILPSLVLYDTNMMVQVYVPPQWVGNDNQTIYIFYEGVKKLPPGIFFSRETKNVLYAANVGDGHLRQINVGKLKGISMK